MVNYKNPESHDMVFIDSSAIDAIRENSRFNNFFESRDLMVFRSPSLEKEINHKNTPETTKIPFNGIRWFTCDDELSFKEKKLEEGIFKIMQGKAVSKDHSSDALHIFHAAKNEGFLIVVEKRILSKRDEISKYLYDEEFGTFKFMKTRFIFTPNEFIQVSVHHQKNKKG